MAGDRLNSVTSVSLEDGTFIRHRFRRVIDATELGDLLPMAGLPYALGAETIADTGEPHAQPTNARPEAVQSLTYPVALRSSPGASGGDGADAGSGAPEAARPAAELRRIPRQPAVLARHPRPCRRDLWRHDRAPFVRRVRAAPEHERRPLGLPPAARRCEARARARRRHLDLQLAGQRLPRPEHRRSAGRRDRRVAPGGQVGEPRVPALDSDRGAARRRRIGLSGDRAGA